jgi:hypothetical protein
MTDASSTAESTQEHYDFSQRDDEYLARLESWTHLHCPTKTDQFHSLQAETISGQRTMDQLRATMQAWNPQAPVPR